MTSNRSEHTFDHPSRSAPARVPGMIRRRVLALALCAGAATVLSSCIVPVDTGANAAAMALDEMDNLAYTLRDESALLQAQIDSLAAQLRKTDSLLRWVANASGNPIPETPAYFLLPMDSVIPTPPPVKIPPPDSVPPGTKIPPPPSQPDTSSSTS